MINIKHVSPQLILPCIVGYYFLIKGAVTGLVALSNSEPKPALDIDMVNYRLEQLEKRLQELVDRFPPV